MIRRFSLVLVFILITCLTLNLSASANPPEPTAPAVNRGGPSAVQPAGAAALAPKLGQPGLNFRYERTFGEHLVPYLADTEHVNRPKGLAIDPTGNLYVVEDFGYRVLKYAPDGSNLLALGQAGVTEHFDGDPIIFAGPKDAALDAGGNMWVADYSRIMQISPAGSFLQHFPATDPWATGTEDDRFDGATGIAVHGNTLFVSDTWNQRVQVFDISGDTPVYQATIGETRVPGDDNGHFNEPHRIAVDSTGRLFVADRNNNRVQRCENGSGSWTCTTLLAGLNHPEGLTVAGGDTVYIADTQNGLVRVCTPAGSCAVTLDSGYWLYDLAVDGSGSIFGSAAYQSTVIKLSGSGDFLGHFVGEETVPYLTDHNHFFYPRVSVDAQGNLLILEELGHRLSKLDKNGKWLWSVGAPGFDAWDNEHFSYPNGVTSDAAGNVYVADGWRVQIFNPNGVYQATLGDAGQGNGQFDWAAGVAVDKLGNIYVADANNRRVQVFNKSRQYVATIGVTGEAGSDNAHFGLPIDVEVDAAGNIYVADTGNCRVQKFNSSRVYQMTFGVTGSCSESLSDVNAEDVAVDAQGRVYIGGWDNRVQVFDSTGAYLTTIGGKWGNSNASFRGVSSVAVDSQGSVYITDANGARIQKYARGVPRWRQININGFGERNNIGAAAMEVFNGQLYAGTVNWTDGTRIWRTDGSGAWAPVTDYRFGQGDGTNTVTLDMIVYKNRLYAATGWSAQPGQVWRTSNGTNWEKVVDAAFGDPENESVYTFAIFNDTLYASTFAENGSHGFEIWRTTTGNSGDWTRVAQSAAPESTGVIAMQVFNGYLYAGVENKATGMEIWRTSNGTNWQPVATGGFGDPSNLYDSGMAVLGGQLYVGTHRDGPGQVWRSSNGVNWTQVDTSAFNTPDHGSLQAMFLYDNALFAYTSHVNGMQLWRSTDGSNWQQWNIDGFGDANNNWAPFSNHAYAVFQGNLVHPVANDSVGVEIWQLGYETFLPNLRR